MQVSQTNVHPLINGKASAGANGTAARGDDRKLYREVPQEFKRTGEWVTPAPKEPEQKPVELFTAYLREFPGLSALDSFIWLDIHDSDLIMCLREMFPSTGSLYERQPGVSVPKSLACTRR